MSDLSYSSDQSVVVFDADSHDSHDMPDGLNNDLQDDLDNDLNNNLNNNLDGDPKDDLDAFPPLYTYDAAKFSPTIPPEILQTILRELSLCDLIRCQRVCKTWAAYLPGDDPELQRALFLRADAAEPSLDMRMGFMLRDPHTNTPRIPSGVQIVAFFGVEGREPKLHPLFRQHSFRRSQCRESGPILGGPDSWKNGPHSWEAMLVTVLAVQNLRINIFWDRGGTYLSILLAAKHDTGGVTLGQVSQALKEGLERANREQGDQAGTLGLGK